jgi:hypothetical protein
LWSGTHPSHFNTGLESVRSINSRAATYIEQTIDKELWSSPFLTAKRYGHSTSNIVESFNSRITEERKLAIVDFLQALWNKTMNSRYERFKDSTNLSIYSAGTLLTKYSAKILESALSHYNATQRHVAFSTPLRATVSTHGGDQYIVNLETQRCSCGLFQEYDIPCVHAISCIYESGRAPRDWVPFNLTLNAYQMTYSVPNLPPTVATRYAGLPSF